MTSQNGKKMHRQYSENKKKHIISGRINKKITLDTLYINRIPAGRENEKTTKKPETKCNNLTKSRK